jgi:hypothetical protein
VAEVRGEPAITRQSNVIGGGHHHVGDCPALRQAIRLASTRIGTPPIAAGASAASASVVFAFWSVAKRTKRQWEKASTAQNRNHPGAA